MNATSGDNDVGRGRSESPLVGGQRNWSKVGKLMSNVADGMIKWRQSSSAPDIFTSRARLGNLDARVGEILCSVLLER